MKTLRKFQGSPDSCLRFQAIPCNFAIVRFDSLSGCQDVLSHCLVVLDFFVPLVSLIFIVPAWIYAPVVTMATGKRYVQSRISLLFNDKRRLGFCMPLTDYQQCVYPKKFKSARFIPVTHFNFLYTSIMSTKTSGAVYDVIFCIARRSYCSTWV